MHQIGHTCRMLRMRRLRTCCNHRLRQRLHTRHAAASTFQSRAPKVCSRIGWASTRGRTNLSALGSCTSVAAPPVSSTSTMTPSVPAAHLLTHTRSAHTQHRPPAQTPAHTCRIYSHGLTVAIVAAAKAGRSTKRPTGSLESTDQRARPPAHTRRMALGPRGMAAPSAATMTSRWSA